MNKQKNVILIAITISCLLLFTNITAAQLEITAVPKEYEQIVLNDRMNYSVIGISLVNEIDILGKTLKPEDGYMLVTVKLRISSDTDNEFTLRPNDFVAVYGTHVIYMTQSIATGIGQGFISDEFEDSLGKMSLTVNSTSETRNDQLSVVFKMPKDIKTFSIMAKTISSIGNLQIPNQRE